LDGMPEGYMYNLFKNVPNWWKDATSDRWFRGFKLEQFSGSIPKNYTNAMIDAQAEFLISKTVAGLATGGSLEKAAKVMDDDSDIKASAFKLQRLTQKLSNIKEQNERDGKEMTSDEFKKQILDGASKLAVKSNTYSLWYEAFASSIFMKYGKDGVIPGRVNKAAKIVSVFAAYTYKMDVVGMDRSSVDNVDYKKRAAYTNYVAERMFMKLNEDKMPDEVPQRGSFWEIDDWGTFSKDWKNPKYATVGVTLKDPEGNNERGEILVETGRLNMRKDFVEFDKWLDDPSLLTRGKKLILPRKDCSFRINTQEQYDEYLLLISEEEEPYDHDVILSDGTNEKYLLGQTSEYTQIEKEFKNSMRKALEKVKDEYGDNCIPEEFDELEREVFDFGFKNDPKVGETTFPVTIDFTTSEYSRFLLEVGYIEAELKGSKIPVTKSIQRKAIEKKVSSLIEKSIINKENFHRYFKSQTAWEWVEAKWEKIKNKLF